MNISPLVDKAALLAAFARNCKCRFDESGVLVKTCDGCVVLGDKESVHRLMFGRHVAQRLLAEEFRPPAAA